MEDVRLVVTFRIPQDPLAQEIGNILLDNHVAYSLTPVEVVHYSQSGGSHELTRFTIPVPQPPTTLVASLWQIGQRMFGRNIIVHIEKEGIHIETPTVEEAVRVLQAIRAESPQPSSPTAETLKKKRGT